MEISTTNRNVMLRIWASLCLFSLCSSMAQGTILKRIRANKEKGVATAESNGQPSYANGMSNNGYSGNGGYGQGGHGRPNRHPSPGGYDPDYYDGNDFPPQNNGYRDGSPTQDVYRGEHSHSPTRYASNAYGNSNGGRGSGGERYGNNQGQGNQYGGGGGTGYRAPPGNGYNDDYYDGYSEDNSNAYGVAHPPGRPPSPSSYDRGHHPNFDRRYNDEEDDYYNPGETNFNNPPPRINHSHAHGDRGSNNGGGHKSTQKLGDHIPEIIITENKPLKASDLENGSPSSPSTSSSSPGRIVEKIRKWRNDRFGEKNTGKTPDLGIRSSS